MNGADLLACIALAAAAQLAAGHITAAHAALAWLGINLWEER